MRRVIDSKAYDTETAELVESWSHDDSRSDASWALYRTRNGAFFLVGTDHSGELDEFRPYTAVEARKFVEKHANHRVEKIFGQAPEASAADHKGPRFSRQTVVAAIGVLERLTQARLSRFLYELGPDFSGLAGDEPVIITYIHGHKTTVENCGPLFTQRETGIPTRCPDASIGVSSRVVMGSQVEVKVSPLVLGEDDPVPRHAPRGGAFIEPTQHELMHQPLRP